MLRKATFDDCSSVYKLVCELENGKLPQKYFAKIYKKQISNENYWQDGSIVGMLNLCFEKQLHHVSKNIKNCKIYSYR